MSDDDNDIKTKKPFLETGVVARLLRWHPNTLRDHLVPAAEWKRGDSSVPSLKLGGRYLIPRWWVDEILKAAKTPGTPETPPNEPK